jgi:hypothetical protein
MNKRGLHIFRKCRVFAGIVLLTVLLTAAERWPSLAESPTSPNLYNATLPLPAITERTVEQVMASAEQTKPDTTIGSSTDNIQIDLEETGATVSSDQAVSQPATGGLVLQPALNEPAAPEAVRAKATAQIEEKILGEATASKSGDFPDRVSLALPANSILGKVEKDDLASDGGPVVVDNDQTNEISETIKYKELPTDEAGSKVLIGATFPVVLCSQITSKTAKAGDPIEAHLKYDLKVGERLVAPKGSLVRGHLDYVLKARSAMHSLVSPTRWYRNSGCVGVCFDELINENGEHIPLLAKPAQTARIVKNKYEGRVLGVNHNGQVTGPWSQQLRYKAIRIGLNAAMAPAGVFSFGAMPVALGVIGAVNPSFAFMKPVGQNVRHRRIKGFAWGFLSGVPGSWLIEDTVIKGQEAVIMPGDELLAEFKQEFTGEAVTDANLLPGADTKVHGQVMPPAAKP